MKKVQFLFMIICLQIPLFAQFKTIAESSEFEEPDEGFARVLQLKNGHSIFFHITIKNGINIKLFDEKCKEKPSRNVQPSFGKLKRSRVDGIFEVNGDAVLIVSELDGKTPVLYRLIIDGSTGKLKKEDKLAELDKLGFLLKRATFSAYYGIPDFKVSKDPYSDNYAVLIYRAHGPASKKMEFVHYGSNHEELSRAYFVMLNDKYNYLTFFDLAVLGDERIIVLASGNNSGKYILANLKKGQHIFSADELNIPAGREPIGGMLKYNPVTKKVMVLVYQKSGEKKSLRHYTSLTAVDPDIHKAEEVIKVQTTAIDQRDKEIFGKRGGFEGIPQGMHINADGSCSVMLEQVEYEERQSSNRVIFNTMLGNTGIIRFDPQGKVLGSYLVPKRHFIPGTLLPPFYIASRETAGQELIWADQYKSFGYLSTPDKNYVLLNDIEENEEHLKKGKLTAIKGVTACDLFSYALEGTDLVPSRKMVFGDAQKGNAHNLAVVIGADYMPSLNRYAVLKLEVTGHKKNVKIVWLQPS